MWNEAVPLARYTNDRILGSYHNGSAPNIKGTLNRVVMYNGTSGSGAFSVGASAGTIPGPNSGQPTQREITFNAYNSNTTYHRNDNIITCFGIYLQYIIKY